VTDEPPLRTKQMVRQCHSPDPMPKDKTAAEVVAEKTTTDPADD
jgi:cation/acetate symporter